MPRTCRLRKAQKESSVLHPWSRTQGYRQKPEEEDKRGEDRGTDDERKAYFVAGRFLLRDWRHAVLGDRGGLGVGHGDGLGWTGVLRWMNGNRFLGIKLEGWRKRGLGKALLYVVVVQTHIN
jgi:hypothetical protein